MQILKSQSSFAYSKLVIGKNVKQQKCQINIFLFWVSKKKYKQFKLDIFVVKQKKEKMDNSKLKKGKNK